MDPGAEGVQSTTKFRVTVLEEADQGCSGFEE
jgi:hypothetical protein